MGGVRGVGPGGDGCNEDGRERCRSLSQVLDHLIFKINRYKLNVDPFLEKKRKKEKNK